MLDVSPRRPPVRVLSSRWRGLCLLLLLTALIPLAWSSDSGSTVQLRWFSATAGELWQLPLDSAATPESNRSPLTAERWFKPAPAVDVPLLDGGRFSLREDGLGSVMILDFWATWCAPCKEELPQLQALYDELREQGLKAFAINVDDPVPVALSYAEALGLSMPLGSYSDELREAYPFSTLPLVVIVDRWGRMRARWDGYEKGYELKIAEVARKFLAEQAPPTEIVAEQLAGDSLLSIEWSRETMAKVGGVTVVPGAAGEGKILAAVGRSLVLYEADGQTGRVWETAQYPGMPRSSAAADAESYMAVAFRPGSEKLLILRMPEGIVESSSSPAPVFDALPLDSSSMLLATYEGLFKTSGDGGQQEQLDGFDGTAAIRLLGEGEERRVIVLEFSGRLSWLDPALKISARTEASADSWRLLADERAPTEAGVVPMAVTAMVTGSFLEDQGSQAALATAAGRLLLVDLPSGRQLLHARWPGISDLAAGDLNGDGRDELVVAAGSRLAVLVQSTP